MANHATDSIGERSPASVSASAPAPAHRDSELERTRLPGNELPDGVFAISAAAYVWMAAFGWLAFGASGGPRLTIDMAGLIVSIVLVLPLVAVAAARRHVGQPRQSLDHGGRYFETATGRLRLGEAVVQVLVIPLSLALAATLFATVKLIEIGSHFAA